MGWWGRQESLARTAPLDRMADDSRAQKVGRSGPFLTMRVLNSKIFAFSERRDYVNIRGAGWHDQWIWLWIWSFDTPFGS